MEGRHGQDGTALVGCGRVALLSISSAANDFASGGLFVRDELGKHCADKVRVSHKDKFYGCEGDAAGV